MNSISIGSAIVQHMSTPVSGDEAEVYLSVFVALADAEKDVSALSACDGNDGCSRSCTASPKPWSSLRITTHRLPAVNH